ncbi:MAG: DUF2793 domain-containing protein [Pseudomonadota bacterium]
MSEPLTFPSTTPITGLPLLFSGQSQKEFFVNQAFTTIDAILFHSIEASLIEPPAESAEGESFRVLPAATSDWEGHDDAIAVKIAGTWHFITPVEGTEVYDKSAKQRLVFNASWQSAVTPVEPAGGSVVDVEARTAISELIGALKTIGLLADQS